MIGNTTFIRCDVKTFHPFLKRRHLASETTCLVLSSQQRKLVDLEVLEVLDNQQQMQQLQVGRASQPLLFVYRFSLVVTLLTLVPTHSPSTSSSCTFRDDDWQPLVDLVVLEVLDNQLQMQQLLVRSLDNLLRQN